MTGVEEVVHPLESTERNETWAYDDDECMYVWKWSNNELYWNTMLPWEYNILRLWVTVDIKQTSRLQLISDEIFIFDFSFSIFVGFKCKCHFIVMVRKAQIDTSAVDVHGSPRQRLEHVPSHGGTLNVPTWDREELIEVTRGEKRLYENISGYKRRYKIRG